MYRFNDRAVSQIVGYACGSLRSRAVLAVLVAGLGASTLSGCTVISVVDAAASTAVGV